MELLPTFFGSLKETIVITLIIFALMIVIELLVLKYKKKIFNFLKKNKFVSYVTSSFFGIIPGCVGTFAMDTAYMTGLLGFGGITAAMVATSGDETFVMLSMLATGELSLQSILLLVGTLFLLGVLGGYLGDFVRRKMKFKTSKKCLIHHHKEEEFKLKHFVTHHIYNHIFKKHIWQIFLWVFAAVFLIEVAGEFVDFDTMMQGTNLIILLLVSALIGLLPISGPNIILIIMFSHGLIPFSILLANSIIQDGHGLLPIMGFSMKDAVRIKLINFFYGLAVGGILLAIGF